MMEAAERVLIQTPDEEECCGSLVLPVAKQCVLRARAEPLHRIAKRGRIPQVVLDGWEP